MNLFIGVLFLYHEFVDIEHCSQSEREIFIQRLKIWLDEVLHILVKEEILNTLNLIICKKNNICLE